MIKKLLLVVLLALPAFGFAQKFGVVNTSNILETLPDMAEVRTQLESASQKFKTEFDNLQERFNKEYTEFQNMDESTPQSIKDRRMQDVQELHQKIQQFQITAQEDLERQQRTLMQPIEEKVMKAIQAVGDEGGFTMVFDAAVPVYVGKDAVDVTPLVKAKLGM